MELLFQKAMDRMESLEVRLNQQLEQKQVPVTPTPAAKEVQPSNQGKPPARGSEEVWESSEEESGEDDDDDEHEYITTPSGDQVSWAIYLLSIDYMLLPMHGYP